MESLVKRMDRICGIFDYILILVCLEVLSKFVCDASSLTVPRSSVAVNGGKVELKCSADENQHVIWGFTSFNTSKDTDIYFGDNISLPFQSRYKIDKNISGQHNLVIDSVDLDHAGRYQCVTIATGNKAVALLTVLDSSPKCSTNTNNADKRIVENGYLRMRCRVGYTGNMIPIFTWIKENTEDAIEANRSTSDSRTVLMTTTSSVIRQLQTDDNGVTFKCKITFQLAKNSQGNAPDYEYTWNYTANDAYGPRNLSITRFDDHLECSADGNPTPTYSWIYVETNRSTNGSVLILDKALDSDKESNVECTAVNAFGTQRKSIPLLKLEDKFTTLSTESDENSTTLSTAGLVLTIQLISVAGLIFLVLGLGFKKFWRSFSAADGHSRNDSVARAASTQIRPSSQELQIEQPVISLMPADNENQETQTTSTAAVEGFSRSDSLARAIQVLPSTDGLQTGLSTEELNSPIPANTENEDSHTAAIRADYCTLTDRPSTAQEPQPYCKLRLNDHPSAEYINQPTEELNSPIPANAENEPQTRSTNTDYCTLADRPSTEQEPKLYCKLRVHDQPISDYINQVSAEEKLPSKCPAYCEITEP